jgi:hypothetical protein
MSTEFIYKSALWTIYERLEHFDKPSFLEAVGRFCHRISETTLNRYQGCIDAYRVGSTETNLFDITEKTKLFEYALHGMYKEAGQSDAFLLGIGGFVIRMVEERIEAYRDDLDGSLPAKEPAIEGNNVAGSPSSLLSSST